MINFDLILASCISYIQGMAALTLWKLMPGIWSQCWCCVPERYVVLLSRDGIIGAWDRSDGSETAGSQ